MKLLFSISYLFVMVKYSTSSSITNPFNENGDISKIIPDYFDSKRSKAFYESKPTVLENVKTLSHDNSCDIGFRFRWSTNVGSSVFSPPVIYSSNKNGKKSIFQNTFSQFIEMISHDGFKPW